MNKNELIGRCGWIAVGAATAQLFVACSSTTTEQPAAAAPRSEPVAVPIPENAAPAGPAAGATSAEAVRQEAERSFEQAKPAQSGRQSPSAAPAGDAGKDETIIVTGTRTRRDDFGAANATTVVTAEDMRNLGVVSVAEMIEQLPDDIAANPPAGDTIDLNMIPSALVSRIETVTGGASATYGADAMSGVVNVPLEGIAATRKRAAPENSDAQGESAAPSLARRSPLSHISPGEELWIISQPPAAAQASDEVADDALGSGVMVARFVPAVYDEQYPNPAAPREIPLPLKHTDVDARIEGYVGTVDVTQQFANPYDQKIEAVYMFPLPEKAAVSEFVMTIGDRHIRGIVREKEEAKQIYTQARAQGYRASLLTQHRPNVFEQQVANIEPGKQIDINIRYYETLAYSDGWYSFVFPTVVGPRYNPPGSADPIEPLPATSFQPTASPAVRYLKPGTQSVHDISIAVDLDPGVAIEEIESSHALKETRRGDRLVHVELADGAVVPNKDFRLDFRVAGDRIKSNLLTYVDKKTDEGYFTLMLYPPADLERLERQPLELVFVLDCSGSMRGAPLEQSKSAIVAALDRLEPDDTFQIIRFSQTASQLGRAPVAATAENIRRARRYVRGLSGSGGTQMIEGIRAALDFPHDDERLRFVTFLTDGYIGNESDILRAVDARLGASRIFSFGVGSSPNRYLLERMASMGRGAVAYLSLQDSGPVVMNAFFDRVSHPAMLDVGIDWGDMRVSDVYPARLPDLFVGRPIVVTGRFTGKANDVRMSGRAARKRVSVDLDYDKSSPTHEFLPNLWARLKIADLNDRLAANPGGGMLLADQIRDTALAYKLMSDYTSFIAVDASGVTAGTNGTTVYQAVPVPDGVHYETTVGR